jgi:hypothetical protein
MSQNSPALLIILFTAARVPRLFPHLHINVSMMSTQDFCIHWTFPKYLVCTDAREAQCQRHSQCKHDGRTYTRASASTFQSAMILRVLIANQFINKERDSFYNRHCQQAISILPKSPASKG